MEAYNNSATGIAVSGFAGPGPKLNATVAESVAANNGASGFAAATGILGATSTTNLLVVRSVAANNGTGVTALGTTAILRIGQSAVAGNSASWQGNVQSFVDNYIAGNSDGDPAPSTIAKK